MPDLPSWLEAVPELGALGLLVYFFLRHLRARDEALAARENARDALLAKQADDRDERFAELLEKTVTALVKTVSALGDLKSLMDELRGAQNRRKRGT